MSDDWQFEREETRFVMKKPSCKDEVFIEYAAVGNNIYD